MVCLMVIRLLVAFFSRSDFFFLLLLSVWFVPAFIKEMTEHCISLSLNISLLVRRFDVKNVCALILALILALALALALTPIRFLNSASTPALVHT